MVRIFTGMFEKHPPPNLGRKHNTLEKVYGWKEIT